MSPWVPWNCDCAWRLQKERTPPLRVSRFSANPLPRSSMSVRMPIRLCMPGRAGRNALRCMPCCADPFVPRPPCGWLVSSPTAFPGARFVCCGFMPGCREPYPVPDNCWRMPTAACSSLPLPIRLPGTRASTPGCRGAEMRSSTCSTMCTAAVRPKRAMSAAGIASWFSIVPVAVALVSTAPEGFDNVSVSVSSPSSCASSSTATSMVCDVCPVPNVSVPLFAV